ncbi:MAG: hypothetical protein EHM13_05075, partial [Acidobacteria bacterium]
IEGTKVIDAWVKAKEPPYFMEFGPPGQHINIGFVQPMTNPAAGPGSVSGQVVNMRLARPPDYGFYNGPPFAHTIPWIGVNDMAVGLGEGIYARPANADGTFSISGLAPGNYQLVIWDQYLDLIFAFHNFTVPPTGGATDLGEIPVFQWFTGLDHYVFVDSNENGMWDTGEAPVSDAVVNLRWRDGTIYQSFGTDTEGFVPFDQVFPFFAWQVAEIDYVRFKSTGVTVVVDAGGPTNPADPWSFGGILNPQAQPENGGAPYRTELGPVLLEGYQGFIGQRSVMMWGKKAYGPGDLDVAPYGDWPLGAGDIDLNGNGIFDHSNGGISGIVHYSTTRAEDNSQLGGPEVWEPGIPNIQVNLYRDAAGRNGNDGVPDDVDGVPGFLPPDVDNYPLGWRDGSAPKGAEDIDRDGDGVFDLNDAIQVAWTDSWDDNLPTGCPGDPADPFYMDGRCYDGLRNWNQVRPALFDGGYAFTSRWELHGGTRVESPGLPGGSFYIVEVATPAGYEVVKDEDKNVDFGDPVTPNQQIGAAAAIDPLAFPPCVGELHTLPDELTLFPGVPLNTTELVDLDPVTPGIQRPLCDRKQVLLNEFQNVGANFFLFTPVPIAGHIYGFILDDTQNEFDPTAPTFGEKFAPPFLPVSIRDWTGKEISRVYSDRWGVYNALVPSTSTANVPQPSGMSPGMYTVCLNDPRIPLPDGTYIQDPQWNQKYSLFCYTFQYMPGTTTYLDTPVVPIAAFAGPDTFPVDCDFPNGTPVINYVTTAGAGPGTGNG